MSVQTYMKVATESFTKATAAEAGSDVGITAAADALIHLGAAAALEVALMGSQSKDVVAMMEAAKIELLRHTKPPAAKAEPAAPRRIGFSV